ncbi:MAG: peptidase domain protein [Chloroflexi bacterium]|nr:peptidase domain protein [Chloroflexota bacterium]
MYSAGSAYRSYTDGGTWFAQGSVDPDNLQAAIGVTMAEIERIRSIPADSEEIAHTVARAAGEQVISEEGNAARASQIASRQILGTDPIEMQLRELARVTPDDVQRVAQRYLGADARLQAIVGPVN